MSRPVSPPRPTVYPSAIDWWVFVLLVIAPGVEIIMAIIMFGSRDIQGGFIFLTIAAIVSAITMAFTWPCRYTIDHDGLSIRCGLIHYYVKHDTIKRVEKTASIRSAPALSLHRVLVETDKRRIIISPKPRDGFIDDLSSMIPKN